jgi:VCBS repeat-containing protein
MREGGGGGGSPGFFPPSGSGDDGSGFTLLSLNNPPVANNDEYSVTEDNTLNVTAPGVLGNDTDLDSDPLAAVLVSGPANGTLTLNTNGSFTYTPNADYSGTDSFTYKANDGQDDSNVATVTITVNPVNDAPLVFNPGGQANAPNDTVSRYVLVYEADGDPVTFSATGLPPGLSIDSASGEITGTIASSAEAGSPYTVTVTASDGTLTDSETFTWTVGYVELLNPGNQHNVVEDDIWLPLTAFDRDGEPLTFSAAGLPPGLSIDTATGEIIGTISSTADAGSPYAVTVTAAHGGHSASQTFNWTVARVGVVNPGDQHSATGDTLSLWVAARAGSGQTLSYSATGLPPGLAMNSDTGEISGTVAATADSGSPYTVTVGVSAGAYSDSATFAWKVTRVLVENPGYQSNYAGDVVSLPVAARANGGPAPQYSATGMPAGLSIDAGTGVISGTVAATAYQQSPHTVTVTATSGTYSDSQTFTWVVSNPIAVANPGDQNNARGDAVYLPIFAELQRYRPARRAEHQRRHRRDHRRHRSVGRRGQPLHGDGDSAERRAERQPELRVDRAPGARGKPGEPGARGGRFRLPDDQRPRLPRRRLHLRGKRPAAGADDGCEHRRHLGYAFRHRRQREHVHGDGHGPARGRHRQPDLPLEGGPRARPGRRQRLPRPRRFRHAADRGADERPRSADLQRHRPARGAVRELQHRTDHRHGQSARAAE